MSAPISAIDGDRDRASGKQDKIVFITHPVCSVDCWQFLPNDPPMSSPSVSRAFHRFVSNAEMRVVHRGMPRSRVTRDDEHKRRVALVRNAQMCATCTNAIAGLGTKNTAPNAPIGQLLLAVASEPRRQGGRVIAIHATSVGAIWHHLKMRMPSPMMLRMRATFFYRSIIST